MMVFSLSESKDCLSLCDLQYLADRNLQSLAELPQLSKTDPQMHYTSTQHGAWQRLRCHIQTAPQTSPDQASAALRLGGRAFQVQPGNTDS